MSPPVRLRRSDQAVPGFTRRRAGRGFVYVDTDGNRITDADTLARIRELVLPPAWRDVWICADPRGHLQATGIDVAGRRQYRYHDRWRELRDREKFDRMLDFGRRLPRLRRQVSHDLASAQELSRERVLGAAVRLLDVGLFRIGSHENGDEDTGLGLATVRREHVRVAGAAVRFDYPAKSGVRRIIEIDEPDSLAVVTALRRRRSGPAELLAYRSGRRWCHLHADDINDYIKAGLGHDGFSAKDFRTWNATVLAATSLAAHAAAASAPGRHRPPSTRRIVNAVTKEVSEALGNTPAVARRSYIDPRVFDLYESGQVARLPVIRRSSPTSRISERVRRRAELGVLELLGDAPVSRTRAGVQQRT
ncbi:MAG TPA: DNA topoisomerase IB [Solirubrobacteraceae bacterium]|nr:DNA topoisomerase IB [Solirubrobacteraceae bacterium]